MRTVVVPMEEELVERIDDYAKRTERDRAKTIRYACEKIVGEKKENGHEKRNRT